MVFTNLAPKFDSSLVDYVHKRKFPTMGPVLTWALRFGTVGVLVGVYQFNTNDIGELQLWLFTYLMFF